MGLFTFLGTDRLFRSIWYRIMYYLKILIQSVTERIMVKFLKPVYHLGVGLLCCVMNYKRNDRKNDF